MYNNNVMEVVNKIPKKKKMYIIDTKWVFTEKEWLQKKKKKKFILLFHYLYVIKKKFFL